jgi:hypothetical protein
MKGHEARRLVRAFSPDAFAEPFAQVGKLARTEDEKRDGQNHQNLRQA